MGEKKRGNKDREERRRGGERREEIDIEDVVDENQMIVEDVELEGTSLREGKGNGRGVWLVMVARGCVTFFSPSRSVPLSVPPPVCPLSSMTKRYLLALALLCSNRERATSTRQDKIFEMPACFPLFIFSKASLSATREDTMSRPDSPNLLSPVYSFVLLIVLCPANERTDEGVDRVIHLHSGTAWAGLVPIQ